MAAVNVDASSGVDDQDAKQLSECLPFKAIDRCSYEEISFEVACSQYPHFNHAAHCMIYAFDNQVLWDKYQKVASIMMQIRFDGTIGFAGGYVDAADDSIVTGLNRELVEEMNLDLNLHKVAQGNHIASHVCNEKKLVTHFYGLEVTNSQYHDIEKRTLTAHEWGLETLGIFRVPLYTWDDNVRGFPMFLTGRFVGNSKQQLLMAIERRNIMSADDIQLAVGRSKDLIAASGRCGD